MAIGKFTQTLQASGDISMIRSSLQVLNASTFATAFETTLIALVFLRSSCNLDHDSRKSAKCPFLDECNDYCHCMWFQTTPD